VHCHCRFAFTHALSPHKRETRTKQKTQENSTNSFEA